MKQILNCYTNWRIDFIILLGIFALLLVSGENETILTHFIGLLLALADIIIARNWRKAGKLQELDNITE